MSVGSDVELALAPGQSEASATVTSLAEEHGEVLFTYRELDPGDLEAQTVLLSLAVELVPAPELVELHERLVAELEAVHAGLARDVLGRSTRRAGEVRGLPRLVRPEEDLQRLERLHGMLDAAVERIRRQPARAMTHEVVRAPWRPGDRLVPGAISSALRESEARVERGRLASVGRVALLRRGLTEDIAEHRLMKQGLERLSRRARQLARACSRSAALFERDEERWGGRGRSGRSVYETDALPRRRQLERFSERALELASRFDALRRRAEFLDACGRARTPLRPSPLFVNGPGYRQAYLALREAERNAGPLVSGEELRIHFRSLSRLYEYWCFVQVVELCRRLYGAPEPHASYELVDDVYRPDLRPGQRFRFVVRAGEEALAELVVHYEPDLLPADWAADSDLPYRAALSDAPLRPDVLVEWIPSEGERALLVLDAKSTRRFDRDDLWRPTDYRTRLFDPETGRQPVRQVFFLHRGASVGVLENLPGYLRGQRGDASSSVLGAIPCLPGRLEPLERVVTRFVGLQLG